MCDVYVWLLGLVNAINVLNARRETSVSKWIVNVHIYTLTHTITFRHSYTGQNLRNSIIFAMYVSVAGLFRFVCLCALFCLYMWCCSTTAATAAVAAVVVIAVVSVKCSSTCAVCMNISYFCTLLFSRKRHNVSL